MKIEDLTLEPEFDLHWQMTACARFAVQGLLRRLRPALSLEVGTYRGGSLQVLSHYSGSVISVDIDPGVPKRLRDKFTNVRFRSGDSRLLLPEIVREINERKMPLGFALIDGDHTTEGVRRDIESLVQLQPVQPLVILLHDSFNPSCRKGMQTADWAGSRFVHQVELDFIPGTYHHEAHDTALARSMWGGFACALLLPDKRTGDLVIEESQKALFEIVKRHSRHRFDFKPTVKRMLLRIFKRFPALQRIRSS